MEISKFVSMQKFFTSRKANNWNVLSAVHAETKDEFKKKVD
jgi:hypothetical protein